MKRVASDNPPQYMGPVYFYGHNCVFARDQSEYQPLPCYYERDASGTVISCWKVRRWTDRIRFLFTGCVYVTQLTFNRGLQPQMVQVESPFRLHSDAAVKPK
jgi:hypothetical protein